MKISIASFILLLPFFFQAQNAKRVLFIGNSYTSVNNLPQLTKDLALSAGDSLIIDSETPGGQTFQGHFASTNVQTKVSQGNWNYVVLQEQSQLPSFPDNQVQEEVFPFAHSLDSMIGVHNPCAKTVFYMTWGRKNGDASNCASWPPVCTYQGMDSLLSLRYMQMADFENALLSPVGRLWHYIRDNHPEIELYDTDGSHPSLAGSYAAACSFYVMFFQKDPTLIASDYGLDAQTALKIRNAAKNIVFDNLASWTQHNQLIAGFETSVFNGVYTFNNTSANANTFHWEFGDGSSSDDVNPSYQFTTNGDYIVSLFASDSCGTMDAYVDTITVTVVGVETINSNKIKVLPNPFTDQFEIQVEGDFSYTLSNLQGEIIHKGNAMYDVMIPIEALQSGSYVLYVQTSDSDRHFYKLIKQ